MLIHDYTIQNIPFKNVDILTSMLRVISNQIYACSERYSEGSGQKTMTLGLMNAIFVVRGTRANWSKG